MPELAKRRGSKLGKNMFTKVVNETALCQFFSLKHLMQLSWIQARFLFVCLLVYFWLCWLFIAVWAFSLVAVQGLRMWWLLLLQSTGCRACKLQELWLQTLEHRLSSDGWCSTACGISWTRNWTLCLSHWQVDSLPLSHQRSPRYLFLYLSGCVKL